MEVAHILPTLLRRLRSEHAPEPWQFNKITHNVPRAPHFLRSQLVMLKVFELDEYLRNFHDPL